MTRVVRRYVITEDMVGAFRKNAPETSKKAAHSNLPRKLTQRDRVLLAIYESEEGLTDAEQQEILGLGPQSQTPRRRELVLTGHIEDSGAIRLTPSGSEAVVWVCTEYGEQQARLLEAVRA